MRRLVLMVCLVAATHLSAQAQNQVAGSGHVFTGVGGSSGGTFLLHFGGGGQAFIHRGLAAGGEIGYIAPGESLGDGVGLFSANVSYHVNGRDFDRKVDPFITGGYSLAFRSGSISGGNVGGGVDYWFKERVGLRTDFRAHLFGNDFANLYGVRVGIVFR